MNVGIVGGAGYIGSALVARAIRTTDWDITVIDDLLFGSHALHQFYPLDERFRFYKRDIRNFWSHDLIKSFDVLINLASLDLNSSKQYPNAAFELNRDVAIKLSKIANENGASYLFTSTCSNYGMKTDEYADEFSKLEPTSVYAQSKVQAEEGIESNNDDALIFRCATAYGLAAQFRSDLLLHEFVRDAIFKEQILLHGASFYRPICHVDDIAAAIIMGIEESADGIYNIGNTEHNFTKLELAQMVKDAVGDKVNISQIENVIDPRNYRVSFEKAGEDFGFETEHSPPYETVKIVEEIESGNINFVERKLRYVP